MNVSNSSGVRVSSSLLRFGLTALLTDCCVAWRLLLPFVLGISLSWRDRTDSDRDSALRRGALSPSLSSEWTYPVLRAPPRWGARFCRGSLPASAAQAPLSKLFVGVNIKLKGVEISDCDLLVIEGHVDATVHSKEMQISPPGTLNGIAQIDQRHAPSIVLVLRLV